MFSFSSAADSRAIADQMPWSARGLPLSLHDFLTEAEQRHPDRPAVSFQLTSDPGARGVTLDWRELVEQSRQVANMLRSLGLREGEVVAYVLPNCLETVMTFLGGAMAGQVAPINPLLEPRQIAAILRETRARVVVTLKAFPHGDIAAKVAEALVEAPMVRNVIEVDLASALPWWQRLALPFLRPRHKPRHRARVLDFRRACASQPADRLTFNDPRVDRIAALFHTGGTTGMPKLARHRVSGMIYNGWLGGTLLFNERDVLLCPLPLFHVMAVYPVLMSAIRTGAHVVYPTPAGYRGAGVLDNFWKLIERWQATFILTVPTAIAALVQRPVDADVSSLRSALSGSAALPIELYNRFKAATGVEIIEGYGLTEATCLVSINPPLQGDKKIGSVGIPVPYTDVRIMVDTPDGLREAATDEVGEICVLNPGVSPGETYLRDASNRGMFADSRHLRTGDLGRIDEDGYLWITGRAKDLIIRGGHNIDPAIIEETLMTHPAVALVGAVGQPDPVAGELPCAFVELREGASATAEELRAFAAAHIVERAAVPRHVEILPGLPRTAVGKIFKPDLRRMAIRRVLAAALAPHDVQVREVLEDSRLGARAILDPGPRADRVAAEGVMAGFTIAWKWL